MMRERDAKLSKSRLILTPVLLSFRLCASLQAYSYIVQAVTDSFLLVLLTGVLYPVIAWGLKEAWFKVVAPQQDEIEGLSEADDVEAGVFISVVTLASAVLQFPNKIAIAQLSSPAAFAASNVLSLAMEVVAKAAVLCWFRNKVVARESLMESTQIVVGSLSPENENGEESKRINGLKRAAHRHHNAQDKKRCKFWAQISER